MFPVARLSSLNPSQVHDKILPLLPEITSPSNPTNSISPLFFAIATMAMAKLTITFLLLFFFLFLVSSSHARDLTDRSEYEVSVPVEDSDSKASILLPTEKFSEYEASKSISDLDQVRTESNPSEITAVDTTETGSDPLVVITFRPINRQFGRRSVPLTFRRGRRGCHHRHSFKPWRLIDSVGDVSYGNDMIVSDERSSPNSGANWGSDREIAIPKRWSEFRHVGPWESFRSDSKEDRKHHHFHHHGEEDQEEQEHEEKSGFLRNFRKFLNQFEF